MKLTKRESKAHAEACLILGKPELNNNDRDFVYMNWRPGANHDVGRGGIFFTPLRMANEFAIWAKCTDKVTRYLDPCAGIGVLSYAMLKNAQMDGTKAEITAVESNHAFVQIGRKLLPEVNWIHGDAFDQKLLRKLGPFDLGYGNPPFGRISTMEKDYSWLKYRGPAHMMAAEVIARRCERGGELIIPMGDCSHPEFFENPYRGRRDEQTDNYKRLIECYPEMVLDPESTDPNMVDPDDEEADGFHLVKVKVAFVGIDFKHNTNPYYEG